MNLSIKFNVRIKNIKLLSNLTNLALQTFDLTNVFHHVMRTPT